MESSNVKTITIFLILSVLNCSFANKDRFYEELYIKPLANAHIYSYFQFTTIWDTDVESNNYDHCHLFPRGLGEIVHRYNVEELHISLTGGLWRHENWGYPVIDAPPGAEIRAWFKNGTTNIDGVWKELTSSLSGLLCASLNFIDLTNSLNPLFSFRPEGVVSGEVNQSNFRYGTLPQEIVCTENLTPWKKLLPCDSKRGLATLLNAGYIHNTNYHSLGIHLRNICRDKRCLETSVELKQTVSLVHDLVIIESGKEDFSVRKLFGSGLSKACPLAPSSKIYIDVSSNETDGTFSLFPPPTERIKSVLVGSTVNLAVYDLKEMHSAGMFNVVLTYKGQKLASLKRPPLLYAHRYLAGYGQQKGGIVTKLVNKHWQSVNVLILENIPWFLPIYLHTLRVEANGASIKPDLIRYIPGKQRIRPTYLEILVKLPPRSTSTVSIEMDYVFLKWQEYPPDASHGFYVGSSVITCVLPLAKNYSGIPLDGSLFSSSFNATRDGYLVQLRTESLIITLPTPDFSMPYNVICLACTVVALAFGPIHNITTKRLRVKDVTVTKGIAATIKDKVVSLFKRKSANADEKVAEESNQDTKKTD